MTKLRGTVVAICAAGALACAALAHEGNVIGYETVQAILVHH